MPAASSGEQITARLQTRADGFLQGHVLRPTPDQAGAPAEEAVSAALVAEMTQKVAAAGGGVAPAEHGDHSGPVLFHKPVSSQPDATKAQEPEVETETEAPAIEHITEDGGATPFNFEWDGADGKSSQEKTLENLDLGSIIPIASIAEKIYERLEKKLISERRRRGL